MVNKAQPLVIIFFNMLYKSMNSNCKCNLVKLS